jgi:hypothetical protein
MEGEPLGQSLTTTKKRGERRRSEVDPKTELRLRGRETINFSIKR